MRSDEFDYALAPELIANRPAAPRDSAKLLIDRGPGVAPQDGVITDVIGEIRPGDVVVLNNTKVLPARVPILRPTGGGGEVLLLTPGADAEVVGDGRARQRWTALCRPTRKIRPAMTLVPATASGDAPCPIHFVAVEHLGEGTWSLEVDVALVGSAGDMALAARFTASLLAALDVCGQLPLPPYLSDPDLVAERYQTVYAKRPASAAAPTAGLHLTPTLLASMEAAGATVVELELIVGLGTFRPLSTDTVEEHEMHQETYAIDRSVWETVRSARRVVAVGTTSVRALESAAASGQLVGSTDLFIKRPYDWKVVDMLMTNFHLPRSTLLVMIDAFVGPRWRDLYDHAIESDYRFLSLGDAMLLRREGLFADAEAPCD